MTVKVTAARLGVSRWTVYRLIARGLPAARVGDRYQVYVHGIDAELASPAVKR